MSPILAFVFFPHTLPKQDCKDMCLFIVILKDPFYPLEIHLRTGACPPGMFNRKAILSEGHFLPKGDWYLQSGTLAPLGMNQWEIVLSIVLPPLTKSLLSPPPSQVQMLVSNGYNI